MNKASFECIVNLLKNYDEQMRNKAEHCADMMADWADCSSSETIKYAEKYQKIRIERQRIYDSIISLEYFIQNELNETGEER